MAGAGWRAWSTTETITLGRMQNNLQDQVVMTYANSTARAGVTAAAGMVSYLTDSDELEAYNGTSWVDVAGGLRYYFNGFGSTDYFGWIDGHTNSMTSPNAADGFAYIINGISGPYFVRDTTDTSRLYFTFGDGNDGWVYDADTEKITLWGSICLDGNNLFFGGEASDDKITLSSSTFTIETDGIQRMQVTDSTGGRMMLGGDVVGFNTADGNLDGGYIQFDNSTHATNSAWMRIVLQDAVGADEVFRITSNNGGNGIITNVAEFQPDNGSAGSPSYTFVLEQDSGMWREGANDIRIGSSGSWCFSTGYNTADKPHANLTTGGALNAVQEVFLRLYTAAASRREWKDQITDITPEEALGVLDALTGVNFVYRPEHANGEDPELCSLNYHSGFIAQDAAEAGVAQMGWVSEDGWQQARQEDLDLWETEGRMPGLEDAVPVNWDRDAVITNLAVAVKYIANHLGLTP